MTLSSRFAAASAFFIAVALFYAPLAYGCTRPDMLPALYALLIAAIATGALSFLARGHRPALSRLALVCVASILLQGWWMTWNPVFLSFISTIGGVTNTTPESIFRLSFDFMATASLLLGAFLVLCDLLTDAHLRRFLLLTAAISGVLICVIGIVLKFAGAPLMHYFWRPREMDWNDFAFYRYHGNAGAFINLVWPLILVFTRRAYTRAGTFTRRVLWTLSALACGSALFLNASKAALVIGLLILPWPFSTALMRLRSKTKFFLVVCAVLIIAGGLFASSELGQEAAFQRMTDTYGFSVSFGARWAAYQQYVNAVPEVGCFGLGPGLFPVAFPYQSSPLGNFTAALRDYAHEDYLQTVLEWGWLGTLPWALLIAGGLYRAIRSYGRRELFVSKTDRHLVLAAILGICGTLAQALIDFPLQVPSIRLFFFVLLALCWASPRLLTSPKKSSQRRYRLPIPSDQLITTSSR